MSWCHGHKYHVTGTRAPGWLCWQSLITPKLAPTIFAIFASVGAERVCGPVQIKWNVHKKQQNDYYCSCITIQGNLPQSNHFTTKNCFTILDTLPLLLLAILNCFVLWIWNTKVAILLWLDADTANNWRYFANVVFEFRKWFEVKLKLILGKKSQQYFKLFNLNIYGPWSEI